MCLTDCVVVVVVVLCTDIAVSAPFVAHEGGAEGTVYIYLGSGGDTIIDTTAVEVCPFFTHIRTHNTRASTRAHTHTHMHT